MTLSPAEKAAGRAFLTTWDVFLVQQPAAAPCSPYVSEFRHDCPARRDASTPIHLREEYQASPQYLVWHGEGGLQASLPEEWPDEATGPLTARSVPAGLFAVFWKEGQCPECKLAVRSSLSRLFLASERPPAEKKRLVSG